MLLIQILAILPFFAAAQDSAPEGLIAASTAQCPPVHLIVARASGERPGEGIISSLSNAIKQAVPGSTSEALNYPAKMPYSGSIPVGVTNLKAAIARYTQQCPSGKLVLLGYSQGGAVITDTLCGGGGKEVGPATPGLTAEEGRLIKAVVSMGDPRFVPGMSYDKGTNKNKGGVAERNRAAAPCPVWASRMVSYCDANDSRCASGSSLEVHKTYTERYNNQAKAFVLEKLQDARPLGGS
ncbi:cutinase [Trichodelitschia bisporula]|uniref:Cutinase n=1 Tax=Trichodelitschia bisporula TaxID=703511 RepID=A0A6G1I9N3_9PEZI|nr:cutinase [Trichodelitschia bisporula]